MQAVTLTQSGVCFDHQYPAPVAQPGEIRVRVIEAGICETDLQLIQGYMGFRGVLGHEFVGTAEEGRYAGRRVVGEINCSCRHCDFCEQGLGTHCPNRTVLGILAHDGAFAQTICVPEANLHPVPDSLSDDEAVFAEPVAAAFQIAAQLDLRRYSRAIVLGDGRLGILCAQVLNLYDCRTTLIGKHPEKLQIFDEMGIETALLDDVAPERAADMVVDCTGSASGLPTACQFVRPRGTIVLKTTVAGNSGPSLAPIVIDEITLVGSRCGPFDRALQALARREIQVTPLISARFPLSEAIAALKAATQVPNLKVLLDVSRSAAAAD
jgi:threonine dehydrogenase-like Zn-dependent dehydrogenase